MEFDSISLSQVTLKEALDEYKTDPRSEWFGFNGDVPSDCRRENYLKLLFSDTSEAAHDALLISQALEAFVVKVPESLEKLEEVGKDLKKVMCNPFLHPSLLTLSQIDSFILKMAELEKKTKVLKRRISFILASYRKEVFSIPSKELRIIDDNSSSGEVRRARKLLEREKRKEGRLERKEVILTCRRILWIKKASKEIKTMEREFSFTSSLYKSIDTNWEQYASSLKEYRSSIKRMGGLKDMECQSLLSSINKGSKRIDDLFRRYGDSLAEIRALFFTPILALPFSSLESKATNALSSFDKLSLWVKYRELFTKAEESGDLEVWFHPKEIEEPKVEEKREETIEKEKNDIIFPEYPLYDVAERGKTLGVDTSSSPLFPTFLSDFLNSLSPIMERDALRLIGSFYGDEGKNRALDLKGILYEERNGFWYQKDGGIKFRQSSMRRDFSHISFEELLDGLLSILSYYKEMTREDLYNKLGEKCGMKNVLSVRYRELDKVLFSSERVSINGEYVTLMENKV